MKIPTKRRNNLLVAAFRQSLHLSQQQLAKNTGIPQSLLAAIEKGKRKPTVATWAKLGAFAASVQLPTWSALFWHSAGLDEKQILALAGWILRQRGIKFSPEQLAPAPELGEGPIWISLDTTARILELSHVEVLQMAHRGDIKGKRISDPQSAEFDFASVAALREKMKK